MNPDTAEVLAIVERAFPFVARPSEAEIPFHSDSCARCEMTLQELRKHRGEQLPFSAIRWFCDELSTLSPRAISWVFPAYLRFVLTAEDVRDPRPTEFLIYALAPAAGCEEEARARLALMDVDQVEALGVLVEYWKGDEHWSEYCGGDLDRAGTFLASLVASRRTRG